MKSFVALSLAAAAMALPQSGSPSGCSSSTSGTFQISTVNVTSGSSKRDVEKRQLAGALTLSLNDGLLKDQAGRSGYIASNYQFQFDAPIQADARETSGFSLCSNSSLALGGSTIFYQCLSGTFYNLYSQSTGAQCIPIHIQAVNKGASVSQVSDGQPQASSAGPVVTQISDGQPQASSAGPVVTQISDGQPQASAPAGPVVSQISDGQPQAPTPVAPVVSQISDGQPQAPTPVAPVVSQISDGQPQVPVATATAPVVTQISDGQPQVPVATATGPVVSQISDGQPQVPAPTGNVTIRPNITSPSVPDFTAAAATTAASVGALAAALLGLFALL
ncbi:uncharacterized protein K460DRAFT_401881 [Cucurbitaria berberidis CBS 394.84]|uniref:Cell wall mannoprotein PIR1-like C-terminal domain-containing protein n=1 Tax=Cucurbitaria berberidis CBS 394.84 TaxID=1168544 RepID=A0A9P4GU95_9PLEO|nr:uncharacterized protein K460DRAFT_401881 [Cucurbitaria berberidis CBS 394.84]KAF1851880.1 hypothetical protein K460DRAFT_401881 [Cucurbitaria berberidis CBS 394.84]